ncbi:hypothetical protein A4D02_10250 [Niastella koreensis]|uniref:Pectinesterase inhibitor domain-containing protein n=2 Tax=Niastella koreensis TaxID=354356 RepID=G8TR12_NIAKG|nr:hypothetical protein [Niastella koreensis]AEV98926.1 hypothetical protein Niako_2586 [Niastella koreensis GR20-10]OQP43850.1 hypothetical protein A4D02_10250 [Niastella koreensis]
MNTFMQTCLLLLTGMFISSTLLANDGHKTPSIFTSQRFVASLKRIDSVMAVNKTISAKVCACQILNLRSNNHDIMNAVVFAEKTNNEGNADFAKAKTRLEKEKRMLLSLFYNKIEVISRTTAATDCNTLYKKLKKMQEDLLMYEVLNADIITK